MKLFLFLLISLVLVNITYTEPRSVRTKNLHRAKIIFSPHVDLLGRFCLCEISAVFFKILKIRICIGKNIIVPYILQAFVKKRGMFKRRTKVGTGLPYGWRKL